MNYAASGGIVISKKHSIDYLIHLIDTECDLSLPEGLEASLKSCEKRDAYILAEDNVNIEFL